MSFLKKLFGSKVAIPPPATVVPAGSTVARATSDDPAKDPNMIRVFDGYGREMFITKQQWRDSVLLDHIKNVWDKPDELYGIIVQSLQDGFGADMVKPAEHLAAIDPIAERGAIILAIVYHDQKRLDDSEKVLRRYMTAHGESGVALINLAKIHSDRGNDKLSLDTLWRALELDPNHDNGFGWYHAIHCEREGEAASLPMTVAIQMPGAVMTPRPYAHRVVTQDNVGLDPIDAQLQFEKIMDTDKETFFGWSNLVVIATDQSDSTVKSGPIRCRASTTRQGKVAKMKHVIVGRNACVPPLDDRGVHFRHGSKWPAAISDDVCVAQVGVGRKPSLHAQS